MHIVILAGGSGTRLWPASRAALPKQFLDMGSGRSLLQECLQRSLALEPEGWVVVVTHQSHVKSTLAQWRELGDDRENFAILPEPVGRNTAPALVYAATFLRDVSAGDDCFLVLASDHKIEPMERYAADVKKAAELAAQGYLVVFGIRPDWAHTGFGYIEAGKEVPPGYKVDSFHEKPDAATAKNYLEKGNFYWNSGMFTFPLAGFLEAIAEHAPEVADPFDGAAQLSDPSSLAAVYDALPSISIDYALMEKSRRVAMIPASFNWSDVGSWDEALKYFREEEGQVFKTQSEGNFVYSDIPVALAGVDNLIVVIRNGTAMICRKGASQLVRDIVGDLKEKGRTEPL